jgi:hypothetical protein
MGKRKEGRNYELHFLSFFPGNMRGERNSCLVIFNFSEV